jgi:hypothetical protein
MKPAPLVMQASIAANMNTPHALSASHSQHSRKKIEKKREQKT